MICCDSTMSRRPARFGSLSEKTGWCNEALDRVTGVLGVN